MKNMLTLCPKYAHFTLNNEIYVQNDGIDIGSPQEPISANAFMVELENTLVPRLHQYVKKWRRYVDDTFAYIRNESIDYVLYYSTRFTLIYVPPMKNEMIESYVFRCLVSYNWNTFRYYSLPKRYL